MNGIENVNISELAKKKLNEMHNTNEAELRLIWSMILKNYLIRKQNSEKYYERVHNTWSILNRGLDKKIKFGEMIDRQEFDKRKINKMGTDNTNLIKYKYEFDDYVKTIIDENDEKRIIEMMDRFPSTPTSIKEKITKGIKPSINTSINEKNMFKLLLDVERYYNTSLLMVLDKKIPENILNLNEFYDLVTGVTKGN